MKKEKATALEVRDVAATILRGVAASESLPTVLDDSLQRDRVDKTIAAVWDVTPSSSLSVELPPSSDFLVASSCISNPPWKLPKEGEALAEPEFLIQECGPDLSVEKTLASLSVVSCPDPVPCFPTRVDRSLDKTGPRFSQLVVKPPIRVKTPNAPVRVAE